MSKIQIQKTTIVNIKVTKNYDIYIGRPSIWGNPYSHLANTLAEYKVTTREEAITNYKKWILTNEDLLKKLPELKDKVLGCYCKPLSCHGDVLIELLDKK